MSPLLGSGPILISLFLRIALASFHLSDSVQWRIAVPATGMKSKVLFIAGLLFCLTPWASPPMALLVGLLFGAIATHPYPGESRQVSKYLLQAAVVGLGFGMNLQQVLRAGKSGFVYTAVGIAFALILGTLIGKLLSVAGSALVPHLYRHRNLRRQRDRGGRACGGSGRRRDVRFAGHHLPAELGGAADLSGDWNVR